MIDSKGFYYAAQLSVIIKQMMENIGLGNVQAAREMANVLLQLHPEDQRVMLAVAEMYLSTQEDMEQGWEWLRGAMASSPEDNEFIALINRFMQAKKKDLALRIAQMNANYYKNSFAAYQWLGMILRECERFEEALPIFKRALEINAGNFQTWCNMGICHMLLHEYEDALVSFEKAVQLNGGISYTLHLKAAASISLGEYEKAKVILRRALELDPNNKNLVVDLCSCYYNRQQNDKALELVDQYLKESPDDLLLLRTKAVVLRQLGRVQDTLHILHGILARHPDDFNTVIALANAYYYSIGDNIKARAYYEKAYELQPDNIEVLQKFPTFLHQSREGGINEKMSLAYKLSVRLLELTPKKQAIANAVQPIFLTLLDYESHEKIASSTNMMLTSIGGFQMGRVKTMQDRLDFVQSHRNWGMIAEEIAQKKPVKHNVRKRLNKKTRVGILSSDLRNHPVGHFVWPIIEHLDRSKFEVYCYSSFPHEPDETQKIISSMVDSFKTYVQESDHMIAQHIADDNLDIMFELGGKTLFSRIEVCAYKPAPVQVSWLGYPHSIGLPTTMDYILVDPYTKPDNLDLIIEKPFMVPETWVVMDENKFQCATIVPTIPEDRKGYITFGTMNAPHKYTPELFATWAAIMHKVPGSRFLYVRLETDSRILQSNFRKLMAQHGISEDRISFVATNHSHFPYYNEIDIALDSFPHTGGTTTCETLWMGVPVVTLVGHSIFERLSYSNINNAGLGDLCTFTVHEYIDRAIELVRDKKLRIHLRQHLRQQIKQQPLGQPKRFVEGIASTIMSVLGRSC